MEPVLPKVLELSALIVICCADEEKVVVPAKIEDSEKSTSLTSWPAEVGFARRSLRVTVSEPALVVNMAEALTLPFATDAPEAVANVKEAPKALEAAIERKTERSRDLRLIRCICSS
ncbi:MAG: hypothetical protein ABJF23_02420 [Bryobacteraceae bacterium]